MVLRNMRYWKLDTSPFCQRWVMVDFWNSWRGEYNDAALKTKCVLTTNQYTNTLTNKQTNKQFITSVPCLWYPIIRPDSNRWKSSHYSPHGLLISKLEHHRRCQTSKKKSRFTIEVHWIVIFPNCVKRNVFFFCSTIKDLQGIREKRIHLLHNNTGELQLQGDRRLTN